MNESNLPPGVYFVGDPCYVFNNDEWRLSICKVIIAGGNTYKNIKFFAASTAYGDGEYTGSNGFEYGVDSGLLGAVPLELVTKKEGLKFGTIIETTNDLVCVENDGTFYIGDITIKTGEDDEEPVDDDGDDDVDFYGEGEEDE